jgi:hypothetical protein
MYIQVMISKQTHQYPFTQRYEQRDGEEPGCSLMSRARNQMDLESLVWQVGECSIESEGTETPA